METPVPRFRAVAVAAHPRVTEAALEAARIADFLAAHGVTSTHGSLYDETLRARVRHGEFDLLVALGGDGTMLRAGHLCAPAGVPVLGINMGRFGFLIEIRRDRWPELLPRLLAGEGWLERRMMLRAEQWREEHMLGAWEVVNEAAVSRGQIMRPVHLHTSVDGIFLTTYVADGLIAATPTGSTAYALAAGGPILPPELRNILLVPVAPHLSVDRPIVLAEGSAVSIRVEFEHEAVLSVDGQPPVMLQSGDQIVVRASEHTLQFLRLQERGYFYRNLTSHMNQNPTIGGRTA